MSLSSIDDEWFPVWCRLEVVVVVVVVSDMLVPGATRHRHTEQEAGVGYDNEGPGDC